MLTLSVHNANGELQASSRRERETLLVYEPEYRDGDSIRIASDTPGCFLILQLDDALAPAFVYLMGTSCTYPIPFGEARTVFSSRAFSGQRHYIHVRYAHRDEIGLRKNLALNPYATHAPGGPFPFASANVETRGEMVFAAKNAIDGMKANHYHGEWPYTSWGINRDPNAAWRIDFGRKVQIDEAVVFLRADFPHDSWWTQGVLHFSDGTSITLHFDKTDAGQSFRFPVKEVEWVTLDHLVKSADPSPFPALSQLELWGTDSPQMPSLSAQPER